VGLNSLKSLNLTNVYPNNKKNNNKKNNNNNNNKVKSKPFELRSRVKINHHIALLSVAKNQTPEGYISKDIYILYPIQKSRKRIFPYHFFEWDMLRYMISYFLGFQSFISYRYPIGELDMLDPYVARASFEPALEVAGGYTIPFKNWQTMPFLKW
jgi:hypothetical protein